MNLKKLFETQKVLRDRINYNEPDRFNKLILALQVEIGECANEWRGFKFWSKDQEPRTYKLEYNPITGDPLQGYRSINYNKNPLLEEYVDGLHFVMDIGLERGFTNRDFQDHNIKTHTYDDITAQFIWISHSVTEVYKSLDEDEYEILVCEYLALGKMLGFTWEQIEQAYFKKNQINHRRQDNGY